MIFCGYAPALHEPATAAVVPSPKSTVTSEIGTSLAGEPANAPSVKATRSPLNRTSRSESMYVAAESCGDGLVVDSGGAVGTVVALLEADGVTFSVSGLMLWVGGGGPPHPMSATAIPTRICPRFMALPWDRFG